VVELRRYTLRPGARETLVEMFEREFIETQEAVGIHLLGQFKDLDDPDVFVWLRGFRDMSVRAAALEAFYGGPVWKQHRDAANATMLDSDDVRLLRPAEPLSELIFDRSRRSPPGTTEVSSAVVTITICSLTADNAPEFPEFFATELEPELRAKGADIVTAFSTEHSPNNFPVLPIREGEELFVWVCRFPDVVAQSNHAARVDLSEVLGDRIDVPPETWTLTPTGRSLLGG
jgi:hypothetical protein